MFQTVLECYFIHCESLITRSMIIPYIKLYKLIRREEKGNLVTLNLFLNCLMSLWKLIYHEPSLLLTSLN
jgi:hypothetical protein